MGNSLGCSASGERLVSAARDGDLMEARMLLRFNPCLAKYTTFGSLNSPIHFAAGKGHNDIVTLLLENGVDVNSRNYCGQTAVMEACRHGHWEVVQTLLLYRCNVTRADYLSGWTALHFAAAGGHVRCLRLLAADLVPSTVSNLQESSLNPMEGDANDRISCQDPSFRHRYDHMALAKFVGRPADGGITSLHVAALNGNAECVRLLLDFNANASAVTFHYGSAMNSIGAGSTVLHYAACGGNLKCCKMLLSRGSSRLALNCNGWLPADVARMWGRRWLKTLLAPNSGTNIPVFPPSNYLALPLMSILNIARDYGLQSFALCDETGLCPVCLERSSNVVAQGCSHELCVKCALYLCSTCGPAPAASGPPGSIPCPLCRNGIVSFSKLQSSPSEQLKPTPSLRLCNPKRLPSSQSGEFCRSHKSMTAGLICPISCAPFSFSSSTTFGCDNLSSPALDPHSIGGSSRHELSELGELNDGRTEKSSCSGRMFWSKRSCRRDHHQSNSEINA